MSVECARGTCRCLPISILLIVTGYLFYATFVRIHLSIPTAVEKTLALSGAATPKPFSSLSLDQAQCRAAFPALTKDIEDTVHLGPFNLSPVRGSVGPVQARIRDDRVSSLV
jgi:hypothetical protein